jgi:hypothetical protein
LHNLILNEFLRLRPVDAIQYTASSCEGLETILIREKTSLQSHKLRKINVDDLLTNIETGYNNTENYLYPNPTTEDINIQLNNKYASEFHYELISTADLVVQSNPLGIINPSGQSRIDISNLANGHYSLRIYSEREEFIFSIIKEV